MQRGGNGMGDFFGFGDPFANLRSSGDPFASFMGSAGPGSIASQFFGGRDPFDDPFFSQPFGGLMGPSMFQRGMFPQLRPFGEPSSTRFVEQQAPRLNSSKGPIIKELNSDGEEAEEEEEEEEREEGNSNAEKKKDKSRKHSRPSKEPFVEDPDEEIDEKKIKHMQFSNDFSRANTVQPQARTYSFQSSTVTYGGPNGAYYTSSNTKRTGGDGVTLEESKEADTTTGKASHRISRGIREKGHSVMRKLNTDGRVETMQALHNLNEDELGGFEEAWKGNARQHLPGWNQNVNMLGQGNNRNNGTGGRNEVLNGRGWALPSTEQPQPSERMKSQRPNSSSKSFNRRAP